MPYFDRPDEARKRIEELENKLAESEQKLAASEQARANAEGQVAESESKSDVVRSEAATTERSSQRGQSAQPSDLGNATVPKSAPGKLRGLLFKIWLACVVVAVPVIVIENFASDDASGTRGDTAEYLGGLRNLQSEICAYSGASSMQYVEPQYRELQAWKAQAGPPESMSTEAAALVAEIEGCYARIRDGSPCASMRCDFNGYDGATEHSCLCQKKDATGGLLRISGELALDRHKAALLACPPLSRRGHAHSRGPLRATFDVSPAGEVESLAMGRTFSAIAKQSATCVESLLRATRFPPSERGGTVQYGINFKPVTPALTPEHGQTGRASRWNSLAVHCARHKRGTDALVVDLSFDVDTDGSIKGIQTTAKGKLADCITAKLRENRSLGPSRKGAHVDTKLTFP